MAQRGDMFGLTTVPFLFDFGAALLSFFLGFQRNPRKKERNADEFYISANVRSVLHDVEPIESLLPLNSKLLY